MQIFLADKRSFEKDNVSRKIIPDIADEGGYSARMAAAEQTDTIAR